MDPTVRVCGELVRPTRFIFVEGIVESGKTTTAEFLTDQLRRNRIPARLLAEGPTTGEPIHPLRVSSELPHPQACWLDLTVDEFVELSLRKWCDYVGEARKSATVTVCDGLLFHGNMTDLLLMNADRPILYRYVADLIQVLRDLDPVVIHLYPADLARALRVIAEERGPQWETYQIGWKVASPFGLRRSLRGFAGLVELYQEYCAVCDEILGQLPIPKLAIRNDGDWPSYYQEILAFLDLPRAGQDSGYAATQAQPGEDGL
jgi:hypothetical protein